MSDDTDDDETVPCEDCHSSDCEAQWIAVRNYPAEAWLRPRIECLERAKEQALAEVARLTATLARVREACQPAPICSCITTTEAGAGCRCQGLDPGAVFRAQMLALLGPP